MIGWLTINRECNLRCKWCYAKEEGFSSNNNIDLRVVRKSVSIMKGLGIKEVCITGGEPTISNDIFNIIRLIVNHGLVPMMVTNGIQLSNKEYLDSLLNAGLGGVSLSLKAPSRKYYKEWARIDAYDRVITAIKNLTDSNIKYSVSFTVTKDSINLLNQLVNVVAESGIKYFNLDLGRPIIDKDGCISDDIPSPRELSKAVVDIYPLLRQAGFHFAISLSIPFCLTPEGFIDTMIEDDTLISGCQIHHGNGFIVNTEGYLLPCNHFCGYPLGKIGKDFDDAEGYKLFRLREEIQSFYSYTANYPDTQCVDCKWWTKCGGGCFVRWLNNDSNELISKWEEVKYYEGTENGRSSL